jgi:hypothetical protein
MKRDGADSEVEGGRFKLRILERGNTDLHRLVRSDLGQDISETDDEGLSNALIFVDVDVVDPVACSARKTRFNVLPFKV